MDRIPAASLVTLRVTTPDAEYSGLQSDAHGLARWFGHTADLMAARLADACFLAGDQKAGQYWSSVFRILAAPEGFTNEAFGNANALN